MKNIEIFIISVFILLLLFIDIQEIKKNRELQTQIDELKIIVDQKFLPPMILDNLDLR